MSKEKYSTEEAWAVTETTNAQADVFRSLADGLRRENLLIKKMLDEKEKKLTEQEIYIEQLEIKIEQLESWFQDLVTKIESLEK
jgi:TolA-binding protein